MLLPLSLLGCYHDAVTSTEAEVVPPAPAPVADRVEKDADVIAILGGALERGACRDGKVRVEGHVVIDAADPTHRDLLIARLGSESLAAAAVAASLLWDARTPLDGSHADAIGHTLLALHQASVDDVQVLHCRSLKAVQGDGILWNARGWAPLLHIRHPGRVWALDVSPDGATVASAGDAKKLAGWASQVHALRYFNSALIEESREAHLH